MFGLLVAIIYLCFISLGLPDSLLGAAWPSMQRQFDVPQSFASIISIIIGAGTVVSSLLSDRLTRRFGAWGVTSASVLLTAVALLMFSLSNNFWLLVAFAVPYGLGAGGVDAALNNYVALHLKSRHMSWLHCMWGVGASISPYIMGCSLAGNGGWNGGYFVVSLIQMVLSAAVFISFPLWKRAECQSIYAAERQNGRISSAKEEKSLKAENVKTAALPLKSIFRISGAPECFLCFFCYCALEQTAMLWGSTYMIARDGLGEDQAAMFASMFFIGITFGRALNGFMTIKFSDRTLIRAGYIILACGVALISMPFGFAFTAAGFVAVGLGCAPVYPGIIHSTPAVFGAENSQAMIGVQMAFAYIGGIAAPLFGLLAEAGAVLFLPAFLAAFLAAMIVLYEIVVVKRRRALIAGGQKV